VQHHEPDTVNDRDVGRLAFGIDVGAGRVDESVSALDEVGHQHWSTRAAPRSGEPILYPGAVTTLIQRYLDNPPERRTPPITEREEEILTLVAEGHSSQQIAEMLVISVKTVDRHRANLLRKLGLKDRLELTRYAIRAGLIEP